MPVPERFILWPGDGPLDAVDDVAALIQSRLDEAILQCDETDTSWLNDVVAYMCCLSAVGHAYGGLTGEYSTMETLRTKVLEIHERSWSSHEKTQKYEEERTYIEAVINSLFEAV